MSIFAKNMSAKRSIPVLILIVGILAISLAFSTSFVYFVYAGDGSGGGAGAGAGSGSGSGGEGEGASPGAASSAGAASEGAAEGAGPAAGDTYGGDGGWGTCITVDEWTPSCAYGCSNGSWGNYIGDDGSCNVTQTNTTPPPTTTTSSDTSGESESGGVGCGTNDCGIGDRCINLPGEQTSIPTGYAQNSGTSNCFPTTCPYTSTWWGGKTYTTGPSCDFCPNLSGAQSSVSAIPAGSVVDSAGQCVLGAPGACSLSAISQTIEAGHSSTLSWSCSQAPSASGLNFSTGGAPSGSASVSPTQTTTYTLSCQDGCNANTTITVTNPNLSISANPTRVHSGDSSTISWSATQVTSCSVTGPNFSTVGLNGSRLSGAITAQSTYTLTCQSAVGARSASVTVNILPSGVEI